MEHRFCKRRSVEIPSKIYIRDKFSGEGRVENLSFDGAYIIFNGAFKIESDSVVRIEFSLPSEGKGDSILTRMPALVVHQSRTGFGVMFIHDDAEFARQLKKVVKCEKLTLNGTES